MSFHGAKIVMFHLPFGGNKKTYNNVVGGVFLPRWCYIKPYAANNSVPLGKSKVGEIHLYKYGHSHTEDLHHHGSKGKVRGDEWC